MSSSPHIPQNSKPTQDHPTQDAHVQRVQDDINDGVNDSMHHADTFDNTLHVTSDKNHNDNAAPDSLFNSKLGVSADVTIDTPDSALLSEWSIRNQTLLFGLNFRKTLTPKSGLINRLRKQEQAMDIDISCVLFDKRCNLIELVWFKKLRSTDGAIRHYGDSLDGTDRGDAAKLDKNIDMERIELKLPKVAAKIEHIALVISSYHGQPLAQVERGNAYLGDDEGNNVLTFNLQNLDETCTAMWVGGLSREMGEWRLSTPRLMLDSHNMKAMTLQISNELARSRVFHTP